jgi:hypothetical protein
MASYQATAEIFMTAFKALPARERSTFLSRLLQDTSLCEDIMDIAVVSKRSHEKTKSFHGFLKFTGKA